MRPKEINLVGLTISLEKVLSWSGNQEKSRWVNLFCIKSPLSIIQLPIFLESGRATLRGLQREICILASPVFNVIFYIDIKTFQTESTLISPTSIELKIFSVERTISFLRSFGD